MVIVLVGHTETVWSISVHGTITISASEDNSVKFWDRAARIHSPSNISREEIIRSVVFASSGRAYLA